jgi:hypothetical protein
VSGSVTVVLPQKTFVFIDTDRSRSRRVRGVLPSIFSYATAFKARSEIFALGSARFLVAVVAATIFAFLLYLTVGSNPEEPFLAAAA